MNEINKKLIDLPIDFYRFFRFNIDLNEPMMKADVIPPLREDLKLPIDEYRDKIYGLLRRRDSKCVPLN